MTILGKRRRDQNRIAVAKSPWHQQTWEARPGDGRVIARGIKNAAAEGFCLMSSPPRGKVHMATDIAH